MAKTNYCKLQAGRFFHDFGNFPYSTCGERLQQSMARILVIDDNAQLRQMLKLTLTQAGHEFIEADSGELGLQLYREAPADLVIIDIILPKKGGLETIQELKYDFPKARVVGISGGFQKKTDNNQSLAELLGVQRTLSKPFTAEDLLKMVTEVLAE